MIRTGDIFHVEYSNYYGSKKRHYFYCIYSQQQDNNNTLSEDVVGLMISSNKKFDNIIKVKNDYNVKVRLNKTESFVCCDKVFRFNINEINVKGNILRDEEKQMILVYYKKFINESLRQLGEINNVRRKRKK